MEEESHLPLLSGRPTNGAVTDGVHRSSSYGILAALGMMVVQTAISVLNINYKLAANDGMSLPLIIAYRFIFGSAVSVPMALLMERNSCSKLSLKIVFYGFAGGMFGGALGQSFVLHGISMASATVASAMANLGPAITFILAICFRLERLRLDTLEGKVKVLGAAVSISGAILIALYEGPPLKLGHHRTNFLQANHDLFYGTLLTFLNTVCYSLFLIIQAKAAAEFPFPYSITAMMTISAAIQGVAYALCVEKDWNEWKLGWNIRLFAVSVNGIITSGLSFPLIAWCIRRSGPIFVSAFTPLCLILTAIGDYLFLHQGPHLGMLLGCIIIGGGLYVVLWAKAKELKKNKDNSSWEENAESALLSG
ncbi:WAT1-related protein At1g68170-like [Andrographis paniculata]|uniref:WAT1-related protein At1g68170-like n=1 Tax=Andrographis paniculata TaxID=175694 RepID=UPI0021E9153B|nr:WAT1-related protein At1g68170-like [Andrographis paniculata]